MHSELFVVAIVDERLNLDFEVWERKVRASLHGHLASRDESNWRGKARRVEAFLLQCLLDGGIDVNHSIAQEIGCDVGLVIGKVTLNNNVCDVGIG